MDWESLWFWIMRTLPSSPASLWLASGSQSSGLFGEAIATIADVTGDGIDEVIVGAPEETGPSGLFVYYGQIHCLSGATGGTVWTKRYINGSSTRYGAEPTKASSCRPSAAPRSRTAAFSLYWTRCSTISPIPR